MLSGKEFLAKGSLNKDLYWAAKNADFIAINNNSKGDDKRAAILAGLSDGSHLDTMDSILNVLDNITHPELRKLIAKNTKEKVVRIICGEKNLNKKMQLLNDAINPNTRLGSFFLIKRGVKKPTIKKGTLRVLENERVKEVRLAEVRGDSSKFIVNFDYFIKYLDSGDFRYALSLVPQSVLDNALFTVINVVYSGRAGIISGLDLSHRARYNWLGLHTVAHHRNSEDLQYLLSLCSFDAIYKALIIGMAPQPNYMAKVNDATSFHAATESTFNTRLKQKKGFIHQAISLYNMTDEPFNSHEFYENETESRVKRALFKNICNEADVNTKANLLNRALDKSDTLGQIMYLQRFLTNANEDHGVLSKLRSELDLLGLLQDKNYRLGLNADISAINNALKINSHENIFSAIYLGLLNGGHLNALTSVVNLTENIENPELKKLIAKECKRKMLNLIVNEADKDKKMQLLNDALDDSCPLGRFFRIKRSVNPPSITRGILKEIDQEHTKILFIDVLEAKKDLSFDDFINASAPENRAKTKFILNFVFGRIPSIVHRFTNEDWQKIIKIWPDLISTHFSAIVQKCSDEQLLFLTNILSNEMIDDLLFHWRDKGWRGLHLVAFYRSETILQAMLAKASPEMIHMALTLGITSAKSIHFEGTKDEEWQASPADMAEYKLKLERTNSDHAWAPVLFTKFNVKSGGIPEDIVDKRVKKAIFKNMCAEPNHQKKMALLNDALDPNNPYGKIMYIQRGVKKPTENNGIRKKIQAEIVRSAEVVMEDAPVLRRRSSSNGFFATSPNISSSSSPSSSATKYKGNL